MTDTHNILVWAEIPVTDLEKSRDYYASVLETELEIIETGPNPMVMFSSGANNEASAHLYPGKPAKGSGNTVHLAVAGTLEDAMDRVTNAGGEVLSDPIPLPGGARFFYSHDLDGNSVGFYATT